MRADWIRGDGGGEKVRAYSYCSSRVMLTYSYAITQRPARCEYVHFSAGSNAPSGVYVFDGGTAFLRVA